MAPAPRLHMRRGGRPVPPRAVRRRRAQAPQGAPAKAGTRGQQREDRERSGQGGRRVGPGL